MHIKKDKHEIKTREQRVSEFHQSPNFEKLVSPNICWFKKLKNGNNCYFFPLFPTAKPRP